ncbi:uncharacterized protein [Magallana gigas]|uniref:uncharacterized protein isoform X2 n=1 Tax=Magallana gigas TaxID=29159 RepID=UPI00333E9F9B
MDHSYQLYLFILLTTTLFTGIKPAGDVSYSWFDAQRQCLGRGLTTEKDKSDQPYWTGVYRRLTPWINILGCYSDSTDILQYEVKKTMIISSVGICQEMCYRSNGYKFAVKMNTCLCIESDIHVNSFNRLLPSDCNYKCEDNTDVIYSGDCGGTSAYNLYEIQEVKLSTEDTCLSLQCSKRDTKFIPERCSKDLSRVCEKINIINTGFASNWTLSMEQCRKHHSGYLFGDVILNNPRHLCSQITSQILVVWVGVRRQKYKNVDQGYQLKEKDTKTFQDCQMCRKNDCCFISCHYLLNSSTFCQNISDTSQHQVTANITMSNKCLTTSILTSTHLTSDELFASTSSTGNYDTNQSPSSNDRQEISNASDELALKISLPVITVFIILLLCAMAVVFYSRRRKMTKADRTTKAQIESGPRKNIGSNVDCVQNNSYFVLEQCPQYISKGSYSPNESPYNNSEEGVYDHLRDKISRKPEVEDTYQHASTGVSGDMSEYDTMANAVNKKQEECDSDDYSHQDSNGNYACDLRAKNNLTDNPYDVAVSNV